MEYTSGEKVYILKKSTGDSLDRVLERRITVGYEKEPIVYNGLKLTVLVGYYNYKKRSSERHVISYVYPVLSGDFYIEGDFITKNNLNKMFVIPEEMWEF